MLWETASGFMSRSFPTTSARNSRGALYDARSLQQPTLLNFSVRDIKHELMELGIKYDDCFDKESLIQRLAGARRNPVNNREPVHHHAVNREPVNNHNAVRDHRNPADIKGNPTNVDRSAFGADAHTTTTSPFGDTGNSPFGGNYSPFGAHYNEPTVNPNPFGSNYEPINPHPMGSPENPSEAYHPGDAFNTFDPGAAFNTVYDGDAFRQGDDRPPAVSYSDWLHGEFNDHEAANGHTASSSGPSTQTADRQTATPESPFYAEPKEAEECLTHRPPRPDIFSATGLIEAGQVAELTGEQLVDEVASRDQYALPLVVQAYAMYSDECKDMFPLLQQAAENWGNDVRVAKLDTARHSTHALSWKITVLPTFLLFSQGMEIARLEGFSTVAELETWVEEEMAADACW
jgi:thiol-disulfide isomerase/thioredoxin